MDTVGGGRDHFNVSPFEVYACSRSLVIGAARRAFHAECETREKQFLVPRFYIFLNRIDRF